MRWALAVGRAVGWMWYHLIPIRVGVARRNLRRVYGAALDAATERRILRGCLRHLGMYGVESLRLPSLTPSLARELVRREGFEHLDAALARGRGAVIVTAHLGNFDLLACSQALLGIPLAVIFKDISWRPAREFYAAVRRRTGIRFIAPRRSKEEIRAALARNEVVAFTVDQHMARHRAIVCEFFGQLAATSPAPARFAFETGATILTAHVERTAEPGSHVATIDPPFVLEAPYDGLEDNVRHNTERLNRVIEGWIRAAPEQWLWLHRRFKVHDDPEGWDIPPALRARVLVAGEVGAGADDSVA